MQKSPLADVFFLDEKMPGDKVFGGSSQGSQVANDIVSPPSRVMGPLPNGHSRLINGGGPNYVSKSWDDPPKGPI